jgi:adenylate cyclase
MTTQEVKRKLTAILSADVKGYSRLMGEDEEWTVRTLSAYRKIMRGLIQQHRGRVVDTPGDNVLAEFASVVDAVQCSVEIQQVLRAKNAVLPENRRMEFRIGINLGDVIEEGDSIYGDGVNIAARLEGLADAGGICISESAYQQIENKLPLRYQYLGEHQVKNITKPVRAYRAQIEPEGAIEKKAKPKQWQRSVIGLVVILIVAVAAIVIWKFYMPPAPQPEVASKEKITAPPSEKPSVTVPTSPAPSVETAPKEKGIPPSPEKVSKTVTPPPPKEEVASKEKMAFPLPDVPSIAVLPFVNMSKDPDQEFLCDGMTEDIITALSKVPRLFVIARNSTSTYKGKPVKVKQVSEELGVRYVLEGSVQRSDDRIRINAQLIDALTGHHLWAERYDRDLKDIFALQDEITMKILVATQVKLTEGEQASSIEKYYTGRQGLDCYLKLTEARGINMRWNIEANNLARRMIEDAIAMCPENPMGYIALGWIYHYNYILGNTKSPRETIEKGIKLAQKTLAMDDSIAGAHVILCYFYLDKGDNDKAIAEAGRAVALNPGDWSALNTYANSLRAAGRPEEAIPFYQKAIRLTPFGASVLYRDFGQALRNTRRFEEAVSAYKKAIQLSPDDILAHISLAATYSYMGREEEARAEATEVLRINPKFSLDSYVKRLPLSMDKSQRDEHINALRKAGLK